MRLEVTGLWRALAERVVAEYRKVQWMTGRNVSIVHLFQVGLDFVA